MDELPPPLIVGAVLFPGFELLDIFGPLELLGLLRERVTLTMVAQSAGPVASAQGPRVIADVAFEDRAAYDVLLIPGGRGTRTEVKNVDFIDQLRAHAGAARQVASICTGSALLAKTGLLDGKRATSNKLALDWVMTQGPLVRWVRQARWTDDGKFLTSSGVSAGMDMALGLIQDLFGRETSLRIARLAEYCWNEDKSHDPFAHSHAPIGHGA